MRVFISCVSKKKDCTCEAKDLYNSTYFDYCLKYARTLTDDKNIYILSALYGVLELTDIISPYEKTLNKMCKSERVEWANRVKNQFVDKNIKHDDEVTILAGKRYYENILDYFDKVNLPLAEYKGIGLQLQFMKNYLSEVSK